MKLIALVSPRGGAGRTTLAANLARMLAMKRRTVLVDLDPQNSLGLHFGMEVGEARGISTHGFTGARAIEYFQASGSAVPYIPFGHSPYHARRGLEAAVASDDGWLGRRLESLCPPATEFVIVDTAAGRTPWSDQAVALADMVLVVLSDDPISYAMIPTIEEMLEELGKMQGRSSAVFYILNQVDGRRALSRDVRSSFALAVGDMLLPIAMVDDEAVREAVGHRRTVVDHAPDSQFTQQMRELADWVLESLG